MSISMPEFSPDRSSENPGSSIGFQRVRFPYRIQCRACGFEPLDAVTPPPRCPKCAGGAWERFVIPRSLVLSATDGCA